MRPASHVPNSLVQDSPPFFRFSVAPMLDWTNGYYRYLARLLSPSTLLYTEMVPLGAILHGDIEQHLAFRTQEHPLALQIGGSDPKGLEQAARMAEPFGFDEINLNVGCPSERVAAGGFGIQLYRDPERVAACVAALAGATDVPVTVKTRIGVDELDSFDYLCAFVERLCAAGMSRLIVHARMAYPTKYSPRDNRSRPPLRYDTVYRLKQCFPTLPVVINGNITSVDAVRAQLEHVDGVMAGRWVYTSPQDLLAVERTLFQADFDVAADEVIERYLERIEPDWGRVSPSVLLRPLQGMFRGEAGSRAWRTALTSFHEGRSGMVPFAIVRQQIKASAERVSPAEKVPKSE